MNNLFDSATPEQKLSILMNELATPVEIIRGFVSVIKKDVESNKIDPEQILNYIARIEEAADRIKRLRSDLIRST